MCGIAGKFNRNGEKVDENLIHRMCSVLKHRGPDEEGYHINANIGLGHARLSIIDLKTGKQPISNENGTVWVIFNGEIYNFPKLKKELQKKGHIFKTHTDTEVIIHLYEEKGNDFVSLLRGMFAIALWDNNKETLLLARDRLGIKPLHYSLNDDYLVFGSEIKAILEDPAISKDLDYTSIDDYFTFSYVPFPKTIFKHIKKLAPGNLLICEKKKTELERYWNISFHNIENYSLQEWEEDLMCKWDETINSHLISDVPLGAFLSGGLDSSSVVAFMSKFMNDPVKTFSIGFEQEKYDETKDAKIISRQFNTDHHILIVKPEATKILDKLLWYYDEPFADSSSICEYYLSQMARKSVKVALSGDGGDENFAGYDRYYIDLLENKIRQNIPPFIRAAVFRTLGKIYPKFDYLPRIFRLKTFFNNISKNHSEAYYNTMSIMRAPLKQKIYNESFQKKLGMYTPYTRIKDIFNEADTNDALSKILYTDIKTYLPDDYLVKVDRASMAHSLEVRPPFLDHEFMELTAKIPSFMKIKDGQLKYIWKETVKNILPKQILTKKKKGFDVPVGHWFRNELKNSFIKYVLASNSASGNFLNLLEIKRMFSLHLRKVSDFSHILWSIFIFELWFRKFIRKESFTALF